MKNVLASFLILTAAATSFATHVDRTQTCTTTTNDYKLVYGGGYSYGGSYTLTNVATGAEAKLYADNEGGDDPSGNMFKVVRESVYSDKTIAADCSEDGLSYEERETKTIAALKFAHLSEEAEEAMGMDSMYTRRFDCTTVTSSPVNCFGGKDIRN